MANRKVLTVRSWENSHRYCLRQPLPYAFRSKTAKLPGRQPLPQSLGAFLTALVLWPVSEGVIRWVWEGKVPYENWFVHTWWHSKWTATGSWGCTETSIDRDSWKTSCSSPFVLNSFSHLVITSQIWLFSLNASPTSIIIILWLQTNEANE